MCGISGYLDTEYGVNVEALRCMTDVIRYRGPDDEGYALIGPQKVGFYAGNDTIPELSLPKIDKTDGEGAFLGFGHRRLSILDLTLGGHQPMAYPERGLVLVFNGEIYNYIELKSELEILGYTFHTTSDTEIILAAYCQWGEDCLAHFNGMWGFALWDGREKKLFCARDRLGAKPFHYARNGNRFIFGSELKQLCQIASSPLHFNHKYLASNLVFHISDYDEQTLISGMQALRPGHKLILHLTETCGAIASMEIRPYWTLQVRYDETVSEQEWVERISAEFSRACQWRLRSDAPVGAMLSGGLDSSCMVTEICSQLQDPKTLHTFTSSYPEDAACEEWKFADMVNQFCGCTGNRIQPQMSNIEGRFENLIWHIEGFGGLAGLGVKFLLDEVSSRGYKVILNGQCGDEMMLGYERYYAFFFSDLLRRGGWEETIREFRLASQHSKLSIWQLMQYYLYFNFPKVRIVRQKRRTTQFVAEELWDNLALSELQGLLFPRNLEELQYTELTATQLPHIVRFDDRLYMSSSIESRIPFMDYRLVELACRVPAKYKIRDGYTKAIMRRIFDNRMPKEVTWRTNKMGFGAPTQKWANMFQQEYLVELLHTAKTAHYFKVDCLEKQLQNNRRSNIFEFLTVELFARQFHVQ